MAIKIFKRTEFKGKSNSDPRITVNTVSGLFYFSSTALDVLEIIEKVNVLFAFDPEEKRAFIIHDEEKEPDSFILKREKTSRNTYKSGFTNKSLGSEFGKIFSKEVYKNKLMMIVEPADQGGYYELLTLPASIMKLKKQVMMKPIELFQRHRAMMIDVLSCEPEWFDKLFFDTGYEFYHRELEPSATKYMIDRELFFRWWRQIWIVQDKALLFDTSDAHFHALKDTGKLAQWYEHMHREEIGYFPPGCLTEAVRRSPQMIHVVK